MKRIAMVGVAAAATLIVGGALAASPQDVTQRAVLLVAAQAQSQNANQTRNANQNHNQNQGNGGEESTETTGAGAASAAGSPSVCFYEGAHFEGAKVCGGPRDEAGTLPPDWDNRISSIEIIGTFEVKVCTEADFKGDC